MQHDALIAAFRQLQTNDERLNAIRALAHELTSHEWRQLQDLAAARNFQTDIVGQLPVELVAQIFAHLDTSTAFWLQSVSRRWRRVLQSPQVLTNTLVPWYGYTPQLLRADYGMCKTKAEVIHAFRNGCPKHHFKIRIVGIHHRMILTEDTLILTAGAQANSDPRILCFFNIKTWELHSMTGDARERISQTFASDQIAGFTTESRVCYVSDLEGRGKRKFRVPNNAFFQSVACRGRTVACAGCLPDHAEVYVWDYDTQQGKTFSIEFNSHLFPFPRVWRNHKHGMALLVQPEIERIIVFTDERCSGGNDFDEAYCQRDEGICTIRYAQFTYDGECISESESLIDEVAPRQQATFQNNNNYFIPVNNRGTFKISIGSFNYAPATRWIQFDEEANTFTQPVPTTENGQMWASRSLFWWKDTVYSSMKATEQMHSPAPSYLTYLGTSDRLRYKPLLLHTRSPEDNVDLVNTRDCVVLNEKYIVRALPHGFHVLCFEDSAQYPKENGAFFDRGYVEVHNVQSSTGLP